MLVAAKIAPTTHLLPTLILKSKPFAHYDEKYDSRMEAMMLEQ